MIERAKRAKATLGAAEASEASQVGEASEPTCSIDCYSSAVVLYSVATDGGAAAAASVRGARVISIVVRL